MSSILTLHNDVKDVSLLPAWLDTLADELALPPDAVMRLNLALEEAAVNVMEYAYPKTENHEFTITSHNVTDNDGKRVVEFVMTDDGVEFDPTKTQAPDVTLSIEDRPIGGLGIFLVKSMMKQVEYCRKDGKNILTMRFEY